MAWDIVLKDKNGNDTEYTSVKSIEVPSTDGEVVTFLNVHQVTCYYATMEEVDGVNYFTIAGQWFAGYASRSMIAAIDDGMCQEWGKLQNGSYQLIIIFSSKSLTAGETYAEDEL